MGVFLMKEKYYKFEVDMKFMNILAMVSFIPVILLCIVFSEFFSKTFTSDIYYLYLVGLMLYFLLHEICHGIGYSIFAKNKKNIKYGIALEKGVLYALCQERISKKGIIVSLLFPVIFLTIIPIIIGVIFGFPTLILYALLNLIGAVADITMCLLIIKLPSDIEYIDYNSDIGAYFISKTDIKDTKIKGFKCVSSGIHDESLIDKSIKRFTITKKSIPYILIFIGIVVINLISVLI